MTLTLYARDSSLARIGELDGWTSFETVLRYNNVSSFLLNVEGGTRDAALLAAAEGVVVVRDGLTLLSGRITTRQAKVDRGAGVLTYAGSDDTLWLSRRLALPVPAGPPYTSQAYDVRTGVAETVIRAYVDANLGPSAAVARRLSGLTLPASAGLGTSVTGTARFDNLLALCQELALVGGTGFRIAQVGSGLQLLQYVPTDRTATAQFSLGLGNLLAYDYGTTEPTATYGYVAGQGEGTARTIVEGSATSPPFRAEAFQDQRDTNDSTALAQSLTQTLLDGQASTALSLQPLDLPSLTYGRDYGLGDKVSVLVEGVTVRDVVREVKLAFTSSGERLEPVVGTPGASSPDVPQLFDQLARQASRLSNLERR